MAFEDFLDHNCDIYHIETTGVSPGYGLPSSNSYSYNAIPDNANVACHFGQKGMGGSESIHQLEPQKQYIDCIKLTLPLDTDIRLNDKVVDSRTGYAYTAEIPRVIRNHHIYVWVKRDGIEAAV